MIYISISLINVLRTWRTAATALSATRPWQMLSYKTVRLVDIHTQLITVHAIMIAWRWHITYRHHHHTQHERWRVCRVIAIREYSVRSVPHGSWERSDRDNTVTGTVLLDYSTNLEVLYGVFTLVFLVSTINILKIALHSLTYKR